MGVVAYGMYRYTQGKHKDDESAWKAKFEYMFFGSFKGNDFTEYGNRAEKSCVQALKQKYSNGIFIHYLYPWFGYNCDFIF